MYSFLAGVDDVLRLLQSLKRGVVEHACFSKTGNTALREAGSPAAHDGGDREALGLFGEGQPLAPSSTINLIFATDAAHRVNPCDGELFGLDGTGFTDGHRAGRGMQLAGDFSIGDREASGVDLGGGETFRGDDGNVWQS